MLHCIKLVFVVLDPLCASEGIDPIRNELDGISFRMESIPSANKR